MAQKPVNSDFLKKIIILYSLCVFGSSKPDCQNILLYSNALALPLKAVALCFISLSLECSTCDVEKPDKPNKYKSSFSLCLSLSLSLHLS